MSANLSKSRGASSLGKPFQMRKTADASAPTPRAGCLRGPGSPASSRGCGASTGGARHSTGARVPLALPGSFTGPQPGKTWTADRLQCLTRPRSKSSSGERGLSAHRHRRLEPPLLPVAPKRVSSCSAQPPGTGQGSSQGGAVTKVPTGSVCYRAEASTAP